jgi:basic membrane protein A and related proteins
MTPSARVLRALSPLLIMFLLVAPAGCLPVPPECRSAEVICVGLVTDTTGLQDYGLNEQAWQVLEQLRQDDIVVDVIESIDVRDYDKNVAYFGDQGYDLVFTSGYGLIETTRSMAEKYPQVSFVMLGQAPDEKDSLPNLAGVIFPEEQAGLWAGALAAHFSEMRIVGAVFANFEIPSVAAYARGFESGARGVDAQIISYEYGSFEASLNDREWGARQAEFLEDFGADVLFAYGGSTGASALEQARGRVIGVEVDFARRFPSMQNRLIASIVFDLSILKEIVDAGKASQPTYEAKYQVIWGNTPAPEVLDSLDSLPLDDADLTEDGDFGEAAVPIIEGNDEDVVPPDDEVEGVDDTDNEDTGDE